MRTIQKAILIAALAGIVPLVGNADVASDIKRDAIEKWPHDQRMQAYEIEKQSEAYRAFNNTDMHFRAVSFDVREALKKRAAATWGNNWVMRMYYMDKQITAYNEIANMSSVDGIPSEVLKRIKLKGAQDWPDDYSMMLYSMKTQIKSYREMTGK